MFLYIIIIIFALVLLSAAYASLRGAPWVPAHKTDVQRVMRLADIKSGDIFYDLGCGDGRMLVAAAKKGAQAVGYEVSLLPYLVSKIRSVKYKNIEIKYRDFFLADLSQADVVYFFLMPKHYKKIQKKFERELKPGTKILAYVWPFKDWQEVKLDEQTDKPKIYVYKIKTD